MKCVASLGYVGRLDGNWTLGQVPVRALKLVMIMDQNLTTDMSFGEVILPLWMRLCCRSYRGSGCTERYNEFGFVPPMYGADEDGAPNTYPSLGEDMGIDIPTLGVVP